MDTAEIIKPYTGETSISPDKVVPAMNDLASAIDVIAQRHNLTAEETAHIVGRICEQYIEKSN